MNQSPSCEDLYNEELMRMILEEVRVYKDRLLIRFCSGEPIEIKLNTLYES